MKNAHQEDYSNQNLIALVSLSLSEAHLLVVDRGEQMVLNTWVAAWVFKESTILKKLIVFACLD